MDAVDAVPDGSDAPGVGEGTGGQPSIEAEGSVPTPESTQEPIAVEQQVQVLGDEVQHVADDGMDTSAESDKALKRTSTIESDSDENRLKRKMGDRVPSTTTEATALSSSEPAKRARDDTDDDNPRERKRPSPPPEPKASEDSNPKPAPEPETPAPKVVCLICLFNSICPSDVCDLKGRFLILCRCSITVCSSERARNFWNQVFTICSHVCKCRYF